MLTQASPRVIPGPPLPLLRYIKGKLRRLRQYSPRHGTTTQLLSSTGRTLRREGPHQEKKPCWMTPLPPGCHLTCTHHTLASDISHQLHFQWPHSKVLPLQILLHETFHGHLRACATGVFDKEASSTSVPLIELSKPYVYRGETLENHQERKIKIEFYSIIQQKTCNSVNSTPSHPL